MHVYNCKYNCCCDCKYNCCYTTATCDYTIAISISGITRRADRYSTQIPAVLACSRPLFDKHQRYNAKSEQLFDTDCSGACM